MRALPQGTSAIAHLSSLEVTTTNSQNQILISDYSLQPRYGCKGPQAENWLSFQGISVPGLINSVCRGSNGVTRVLQLGQTEFLVEADHQTINALYSNPRQPGVYPVCRQDACIGLQGLNLNALLLQICNINFHGPTVTNTSVVLTSMAGVSVIVVPDLLAPIPNCTIWCDGTYGHYLWRTLQAIAMQLDCEAKATSSSLN